MKKRVAYIAFPPTPGTAAELLTNVKRIDGLNIRFSAKVYTTAGIAATTTLTLYNLNREDAEFLQTSVSTLPKKQNLLQLYAGYEGNVQQIASGMILSATPQGNPDIGLEVELIGGAQWLNYNMTIQKQKTTVLELLQEAAKQMEFQLLIDVSAKDNELLYKTIDNFSFTNSPFELLREVQAIVGGFSTEKKNSLNILTDSKSITVWSPTVRGEFNTRVISMSTGMVGYPMPTTQGVKVKILLDPSIKVGEPIHVISERAPFITGDYYVVSIEHSGELRGAEWYTTLNCARVGGNGGVV